MPLVVFYTIGCILCNWLVIVQGKKLLFNYCVCFVGCKMPKENKKSSATRFQVINAIQL